MKKILEVDFDFYQLIINELENVSVNVFCAELAFFNSIPFYKINANYQIKKKPIQLR